MPNAMSKILLDTNLLLRFLTGDDPKKAKSVELLLKTSKQPLTVTDMAFAELAWVMVSFYGFEKSKIIAKLASILDMGTIKASKKLLRQSLVIYARHNIDFIDAYHAAFMKLKSYYAIYSYDRDFDKVAGLKRLEP